VRTTIAEAIIPFAIAEQTTHLIVVLNVHPASSADTSFASFWSSIVSCCRLLMANCQLSAKLNIVDGCHGDLLRDSSKPGGLQRDFAGIIKEHGSRIEGLMLDGCESMGCTCPSDRKSPLVKSPPLPLVPAVTAVEGLSDTCVVFGWLGSPHSELSAQSSFFGMIYVYLVRSSTAVAGAQAVAGFPAVLRGLPVEAGEEPPRLAIDTPQRQ
jgi:hypothetical protein